MRDTNIVVMAGRLTKDPEVSQTQNGFKSVKFTLANSDDFKKKDGEEVKRTNFVMCEAYGGTADIIDKYTQKGKQVVVSGKMYVRESEKEGKRSWFTGITVENVQLFGGKGGSDSSDQNQSSKKQTEATPSRNNFGNDLEPLEFPEELMGDMVGNDVQIPF